jgi:hypothetical protein
MVFTIQHIAWPLPWLFCPQQGRSQTTQAAFLLCRLTQRKTALLREGIDSTPLPLPRDAASVAQERRARLHQLGFIDLIMAGTGNDVLTIDAQTGEASTWKKVLRLEEPTWGIEGPSCRLWGSRPTCGSLLLCCFRKRTTRSYDVLHLSQRS